LTKNELEAKIYFVIEIINDEKPALFLDSPFIQLAAKIKAEIDFDLYIL
jgi:hypothetical protein